MSAAPPVADPSVPAARPVPRGGVWLAAARPRTLPAAAAPVLMGTAIAFADGRGHAASALVTLACALLLQIGANLVNDLVDAAKGSDTEARVGPLRVVSAGLVTPRSMTRATVAVFALAFALGMGLVARAGWPILAIGIASIGAAVAYTAGKRALAYLGLGDVFAFAFFGPVAVAGTYYAQAVAPSWVAAVAGIGPGLLAVALLVANNLRDVDEDRAASKRTLIVRFGRPFGARLFAACHILAALVPVALWVATSAHTGAVLAAAVLPLASRDLAAVRTATTADVLIPILGRTGQRMALYGLVFSIGWLLT